MAVDTHGYTDFAMALARLLGFDLCPRSKDLKQRHLFVPRGTKVPAAIAAVCEANVDIARIEKHWDSLVHLSASVMSIPTMHELGYQEELFGIWFSFRAPAGIPDDARKALVGAIEHAVGTLCHGKTDGARHLAELRHTRADRGRNPRELQAGGRDGQEDRFGQMKRSCSRRKRSIAAGLPRRRAHPAPRRRNKDACGIRRARRAVRLGH